MNCDRIAPVYRWLEYAAFGQQLEKHRIAFLHAAAGRRHALVLGDGDGRFTHALAIDYPDLEIDFLDISAGMIRRARKRLASFPKVRIFQADALQFTFPEEQYEIVFTHFFLDCFTSADLEVLMPHVARSLAPRASWIVSEFRQAPAGWRKLYTKTLLGIMYLFFRFATGLKTSRLPDYDSALQAAGFSKQTEKVSRGGLIVSEVWRS